MKFETVTIYRWDDGKYVWAGIGTLTYQEGYPPYIECEANLPDEVYNQIQEALDNFDEGLPVECRRYTGGDITGEVEADNGDKYMWEVKGEVEA